MTVPLADELTAQASRLEQLAADSERLDQSAVFTPGGLRTIANLLRTAADVVQVGHDHRPAAPLEAGAVVVNVSPAPTFDDGFAAGVRRGYDQGVADGRSRGRR